MRLSSGLWNRTNNSDKITAIQRVINIYIYHGFCRVYKNILLDDFRNKTALTGSFRDFIPDIIFYVNTPGLLIIIGGIFMSECHMI